jgi:hypothetical protein
MTDLNDLNRNIALGNLAGLAQHREAMQRQNEIAGLLRQQEQEKERQRRLPKCPKCKLPVEVGAELCPSCRTEIVVTPLLSSHWCKKAVGNAHGVFAKAEAAVRIKGLLDGLRESHDRSAREAQKLVAGISKASQPLKLLVAIEDKLAEYGRCQNSIQIADATKSNKDGCLLQLGSLMLAAGVFFAITKYCMSLAEKRGEVLANTWYFNWFTILIFGAVSLFVGFFIMQLLAEGSDWLSGSHRHVNSATKATEDAIDAINASLRVACDKVFPKDCETVAGQCRELASTLNRLGQCAQDESKDWQTLAVLGQDFGVPASAIPSSGIPSIENFTADFQLADVEQLKRFIHSAGRAEKAMDATASHGSYVPEGKAGAKKVPQLWIKTPNGKRHGPFASHDVMKAIASGKIPNGSASATALDGPWTPVFDTVGKDNPKDSDKGFFDN